MSSLPNFDALRDLHNSANDLLHSPETQQFLVNHKQEKWVHEVSEASLRMIEVCGMSKDAFLLVKEHLLGLQSTLRRTSVEETNACAPVKAYNVYRKKLKKETLKCLRSLKAMKSKPVISDIRPSDQNLTIVEEVLREVRVTTISIVESLLSLVSIPWLDRKTAKGSLKSKFLSLRSKNSHDFCDEMELHSANKRLEAVEMAVQDLEAEIQSMYRRLIQTRILLLNILTK